MTETNMKVITKLEEHRGEIVELAIKIFPDFEGVLIGKHDENNPQLESRAVVSTILLTGLMTYYLGYTRPEQVVVDYVQSLSQGLFNLGIAAAHVQGKAKH